MIFKVKCPYKERLTIILFKILILKNSNNYQHLKNITGTVGLQKDF